MSEEAPDTGGGVDRITEAFGLDEGRTAGLLRVTPAELADWRGGGVPADRASEVKALAALAARLQDSLRPETVPSVMRAPVPGGSGWSALDAIRAGHYDAVIALMAPIGDYVMDADPASGRQERMDQAREAVEQDLGPAATWTPGTAARASNPTATDSEPDSPPTTERPVERRPT